MNKNIYLALAVIGLILPYSQFVPFLMENGVDVGLVVSEITSSRIAAFGWLDVAITAIVVVVLALDERDDTDNWWLPILATFLIGPSCGLPLLLYLRKD